MPDLTLELVKAEIGKICMRKRKNKPEQPLPENYWSSYKGKDLHFVSSLAFSLSLSSLNTLPVFRQERRQHNQEGLFYALDCIKPSTSKEKKTRGKARDGHSQFDKWGGSRAAQRLVESQKKAEKEGERGKQQSQFLPEHWGKRAGRETNELWRTLSRMNNFWTIFQKTSKINYFQQTNQSVFFGCLIFIPHLARTVVTVTFYLPGQVSFFVFLSHSFWILFFGGIPCKIQKLKKTLLFWRAFIEGLLAQRKLAESEGIK